jgi:uncharacterized metal-binding protein YceD (DUF177 family)
MDQPMTDAAPSRPTRFRTGGLSPRKPTRFRYEPDAAERATLATELGLLGLAHLRLEGEIRPLSRDELLLTARLEARADQACVVTLAPVPARIDEEVRRRFVADLNTPEGDESEMPEDDTVEPMPEMIDLAEVAAEALALALPEYPRAKGAELGALEHSPPGAAPIEEPERKPFAGLAGLAERLGNAVKDDPKEDPKDKG